MRIIAIRPAPPGGNVVAFVDVEIDERLRLFNLRLHRNQGGEFRIFAHGTAGRHSVGFAPDLAVEITRAAVAAYRSQSPNVRNAA
ncbi:hypothetical protein MWN34_12555 [Ancylobacter sp. 6x-1]|uniref:Uncharacterized protein n=1 Tax=Ancylobacter crimeensis TaxID=2579147 RepID=A0ABT0DCP7_9HYPH|nr:hypothetical protein [Ancylobacter crimeensis]MCK0197743.1 hypothetical protein [Ancylobacter crimeensis]